MGNLRNLALSAGVGGGGKEQDRSGGGEVPNSLSDFSTGHPREVEVETNGIGLLGLERGDRILTAFERPDAESGVLKEEAKKLSLRHFVLDNEDKPFENGAFHGIASV